jgi:hypothetical protein
VTLTRRDVVIGATAAVAAAALPGVSMAASEKRGVVLSGSRELADAGAQVGDWYWDFPTPADGARMGFPVQPRGQVPDSGGRRDRRTDCLGRGGRGPAAGFVF